MIFARSAHFCGKCIPIIERLDRRVIQPLSDEQSMSNSISAWKDWRWTGAGRPKFDVYRNTFVKQYLPHVQLYDTFVQRLVIGAHDGRAVIPVSLFQRLAPQTCPDSDSRFMVLLQAT
jgi:hypothetical protein